ncbi:MAG: thioredoxin domain-containing protein [Myxococcaceae bacterium]|nr:thioredoxin domain-containing protein [Myxococcaceae bacterium]
MNRLSTETSPYLRQHQDNPVDWYPWGEDAIARARAEDKPILLSVGYSACHWCHVMAHESFEDPATAALMNAHFINVKVDREERPDVDQLYQGVVQLMRRGGGWPLTVFLTPKLEPFFGGTYFPGEAKYGMPAFSMILTRLADAWKGQRGELLSQAKRFTEGLTELATGALDAHDSKALTPEALVAAARGLLEMVDPVHGGFGHGGPKFPNPMNVMLLMRAYRRTGDGELRGAALHALKAMAAGGIHDHLGGGFHRYAVDERWLVPHFEKMLYDNAQLLRLYAEGFQLTFDDRFREVAEGIAGYLEREMREPHGGYVAAFDADSEGEEGKFFVWTPAELEQALGESDARLAAEYFQVTAAGSFEHGTSVLETPRSLAEVARAVGMAEDVARMRLMTIRGCLLEVRSRRVPPGRDDKVLTGWNGLTIDALAFASRVFDRRDWRTLAQDAARFALRTLVKPDGTLWRSFQGGVARHQGLLEDSGGLALGLVSLYQADGDAQWLEAAEKIADAAVTTFWDKQREAFWSAPRGTPNLVVPPYSMHDNATPAGASTLTHALVGLAALTGRARHLERATVYLERMREELVHNPFGYGHLWLAADAALDGAAELTLVGPARARMPFVSAVAARFCPTLHLAVHEPGAPVPAVLAEQLAHRAAGDGVQAYLCRNFSCLPPMSTAEAVATALAELDAP